jgi:DNA-binding response OmpR family regulator
MSGGPILVVDDDPKIVTLVRTYLEREGLPVATAGDGKTALAAFAQSMPRLIVLDIMLPELDGLALMRIVRERSEVPIILLSARASTADRVYGIHEGADDYVVKPFSPAELVVRVKAVLRRSERSAQAVKSGGALTHADLSIDLDRFEVRRGSQKIALTAAEYRLLTALVQADGRVLTRQALLDALYGPVQGDALERTIDVHIGRLRDKLGDPPDKPRYIATVRGAGYRSVDGARP